MTVKVLHSRAEKDRNQVLTYLRRTHDTNYYTNFRFRLSRLYFLTSEPIQSNRKSVKESGKVKMDTFGREFHSSKLEWFPQKNWVRSWLKKKQQSKKAHFTPFREVSVVNRSTYYFETNNVTNDFSYLFYRNRLSQNHRSPDIVTSIMSCSVTTFWDTYCSNRRCELGGRRWHTLISEININRWSFTCLYTSHRDPMMEGTKHRSRRPRSYWQKRKRNLINSSILLRPKWTNLGK